MSNNRFTLFANDAFKFVTIDPKNFISAVTNGNSPIIDMLLEAKKQGAALDLNRSSENHETPLEILLKRHDFNNASKLIKAGAVMGKSIDESYDHDYCSRWVYHSFFELFSKETPIIEFLKKEAPLEFMKYQYGQDFTYEKAKAQYETAKAAFEYCQSVTAEMKAAQEKEELGAACKM